MDQGTTPRDGHRSSPADWPLRPRTQRGSWALKSWADPTPCSPITPPSTTRATVHSTTEKLSDWTTRKNIVGRRPRPRPDASRAYAGAWRRLRCRRGSKQLALHRNYWLIDGICEMAALLPVTSSVIFVGERGQPRVCLSPQPLQGRDDGSQADEAAAHHRRRLHRLLEEDADLTISLPSRRCHGIVDCDCDRAAA